MSIDELKATIAELHACSGRRAVAMTELNADLDELRHRLADAKRNEERAVGEVGELKAERNNVRQRLTKALRLDDSHGPTPATMDFIVATVDAVTRMAAGPVASLMSEPMVECETSRLRAKLNTLEAAVRAVRDARDNGFASDMLDILSKRKALYALVPDGSEGGS